MITDKVDGGYLPVYLRIAAELGPAARVCELGVDQGASMDLWIALFPYGDITGVDVKPEQDNWPERCRYIRMSQEAPGLPAALGGTFDLIVDDASHVGVHTMAAFLNLWPLVNAGGYYVIEDWMIGLAQFEGHPMHDPAMFSTVSSMLGMLDSKDAAVDEIIYRYGLCVIHKRSEW